MELSWEEALGEIEAGWRGKQRGPLRYFPAELIDQQKKRSRIRFWGRADGIGIVVRTTSVDVRAEHGSAAHAIGAMLNRVAEDQDRRRTLAVTRVKTKPSLGVTIEMRREIKRELMFLGIEPEQCSLEDLYAGIYPHGDNTVELEDSAVTFHRCQLCRSVKSMSLCNDSDRQNSGSMDRINRSILAPWHRKFCPEV